MSSKLKLKLNKDHHIETEDLKWWLEETMEAIMKINPAGVYEPDCPWHKRFACLTRGIDVGWEIFQMILDVASGRKQPWSDRWGIHNDITLFNPAPIT